MAEYRKKYRASLITFLIFLTSKADAKLLQIIHTNDLHSHLEYSEDRVHGGYAAVKKTIDKIKARATAQGIESLTLDAGDFTEGHTLYLAEQGRAVWKVMNAMGYDAVVLGNHDWLMGQEELDHILGSIHPTFPILGANFILDDRRKNLAQNIHPHIEITRAGMRIAILGLTTQDFFYNWLAGEGFIWPPISEARERLPDLRGNNDFVIALTHIGVNDDVSLVKNTGGIDLVVGGHSHTVLKTPLYAVDKRHRMVPIVQAGANGKYVGDLIVDLEPGSPARVVRYQLIEVNPRDGTDPVVEKRVLEARRAFEDEYGHDWLHEVVGYTEVPIVAPYKGPTTWGNLVADAIRDAGKAEAAVDVAEFYGDDMPAGPVTREQLFAFYPRVFDFNPYGWTVWTTKIRGWILKIILEQSIKHGLVFNTSGITYEATQKNGKLSVRNIRINGKKIKALKNYKLALPEGIGRGAAEIIPILQLIFKQLTDTHIPVWLAIEQRFRKVGTIRPAPLMRPPLP